MTNKRPTVITVFGVLNIIFGSLGLLCSLCGGAGIVVIAIALNQPAQGNRELEEVQQMMRTLTESVPGFVPFLFASIFVSLVLSAILLFAGIGLLNMKSWGRTASIIYAVAMIILQIASLGYTLAVVNPAMEDFQEQMAAKFNKGPQENPFGNAAQSIVSTIISLTYSIVLLIFMLMPSVADAFKPGRDRGYDQYDRDQETDDYERRRSDEPT